MRVAGFVLSCLPALALSTAPSGSCNADGHGGAPCDSDATAGGGGAVTGVTGVTAMAHLYDPSGREARYAGNTAQHLLDLYAASAVFE